MLRPVQNQAYSGYIDVGCGSKIHGTAILGLPPMYSSTFARTPSSDELLLPLIGENVTVGPYAILYRGCEIGDGSQICPYAHVREGAKIGERCVIGVGVRIGFDAKIGDDVQIMDDTHISGGTIIGDRCFISVQVLMVNDDRPRGYKWKGVTPVEIGDDVVVGAGARLRPGITIGPGATIGMGAIVTRSVLANSTVKGFPARVTSIEREYDMAEHRWKEAVL